MQKVNPPIDYKKDKLGTIFENATQIHKNKYSFYPHLEWSGRYFQVDEKKRVLQKKYYHLFL